MRCRIRSCFTPAILFCSLLAACPCARGASYTFSSTHRFIINSVSDGDDELQQMPDDLTVEAEFMGTDLAGMIGNASAFSSSSMSLNTDDLNTNQDDPIVSGSKFRGLDLTGTVDTSEGAVESLGIGELITLKVSGEGVAQEPPVSAAQSIASMAGLFSFKNESATETFELMISTTGMSFGQAITRGPNEFASAGTVTIVTPPEIFDLLDDIIGLDEDEADEFINNLPRSQREMVIENFHVWGVVAPDIAEIDVYSSDISFEVGPQETKRIALAILGRGTALVIPEPSTLMLALLTTSAAGFRRRRRSYRP